MSDFLGRIGLTRETVHSLLARRRTAASAAARVAARYAVPPPAPYIKIGSNHFFYALLIAGDASQEEAIAVLEEQGILVNKRTAQNWESQLRAAGKAYFGSEVDYAFLADFCTNNQVRKAYECIDREQRDRSASTNASASNRKPA